MIHSVNILKVNEVRNGISKLGKAYSMQDCECVLLDEHGAAVVVGVLMLPKDLTGKVVAGMYTATFVPGVDQERRITARLVGLVPLMPRQVKS